MLMPLIMVCLMTLDFSPAVTSNFSFINVAILHHGYIYFTWGTEVSLIGWFFGIWSPLPTIGASAAFGCTSQEVRLHCITNDVGISTNFIRIYIIFGESFFVVHVLPRTALVVHINDIPLHLGEGGVIADDLFRFDALKSFEKISTHKQIKTQSVEKVRLELGFF